jgi:hypothetical protein
LSAGCDVDERKHRCDIVARACYAGGLDDFSKAIRESVVTSSWLCFSGFWGSYIRIRNEHRENHGIRVNPDSPRVRFAVALGRSGAGSESE